MAVPPSIPTSFVPHNPAGARGFRTDYTGAFAFFAYLVLAVMVGLAVAAFLYGRILVGVQGSKDALLADKLSKIQPAEVEEFLRLRDRLTSSQTLINNHVALSHFLKAVGDTVPVTVRLSTLHVTIGSMGVPEVTGAGTAKTFNALAAASIAFANDGHFKDVIFSDIKINTRDGSVSFSLSASVDPKFVSYTP